MQALLQELERLRRLPDAKILDVGGAVAPCRLGTHMMDIQSYGNVNWPGAYGPERQPGARVSVENFIQCDLNAIDRFPFPDNYFDFVICRHTLEDIRDPVSVCRELSRVAKAGYIETPHRVYESTLGVERPAWAGHYHHRWLVEMDERGITFQFKPHNLHSRGAYHFRRWPWQRVREEFKNTHLLWRGSFEARERIIIEYGDVKKDLESYKESQSGKTIFRPRWSEL